MIPTLNQHTELRRSLDSTRRFGVERIVVDGGSEDGTRSVARFLRAERVMRSFPERSVQMQVGLSAARADVVLFLDAETRLDSDWDRAILAALEDSRVVGGAFGLAYEGEGVFYRWLELQNRISTRVFGLPAHEQGLFARRKWLLERGGIPSVPLFADLDLARALREQGRAVWLKTRASVPVSRYVEGGRLRVFGAEMIERIGYLLDFDRSRLARWAQRRGYVR